MASMNISLPEEMKAFIEGQVAAEGYASVSEYLLALVREDQKRKARRELESKLLEGLQGPVREMNREDWELLKREASEGLVGAAPRP
jgi:antitoxin ParD1/3/4